MGWLRPGGAPVFRGGEQPEGVWIVRSGMIELSTGAGRRKIVVQMLYPGSVDGDIQLILGMALLYSARALETSRCLFLTSEAFEALLREHATVARRWLSSVAARVSRGQERLMGLLGRSLVEQTARLLLDEQHDGRVPLPQRTLAAMLGVQRPSLNKVLKGPREKERDRARLRTHRDLGRDGSRVSRSIGADLRSESMRWRPS